MRPSIGIKAQAVRKKFVDTFTRADITNSPGVATDGSKWDIAAGTFSIVSNKLTTVTGAGTYPMMTTDMGVENVSVELAAPDQGAMVSLWVTESNSWWGVQKYSQAESCNCYNYSYSCNCYNYSYSCNCVDSYTAPTCGFWTGFYCIYYTGGGTTTTCQTCSGTSCSTCSGTSCSTCYPQYLRILKSVSGSISVMWSQAVSTLISAFRVKTSNNVITIQAYSDYNFSSQIGSDLTYAADNPTKTKRFGLAISPSSYGQGSTINKISIDRN